MDIHTSRKDYIPVNGILQNNSGKTYMVIETPLMEEQDDCTVCAFGNRKKEFCLSIKCECGARTDRKNVIFIRYHLEVKDAA